MTGDQAVGLTCAFAFGVLVTLTTEDWRRDQREARGLPPARAVIDPAPASHQLQLPLCDAGGWAASCADGRECRISCLGTLRVHDAATPGLEAKGNFERPRKRTPD